MNVSDSTIVALATPQGVGAIGVIRLSGPEAISIANSVFSKDLSNKAGHTAHFGDIRDGETILDEVLMTLFKDGKSYTGEEVVEISCHGSPYILQNVMRLLTSKGAVPAEPGEFTLRAFLNGKLDLSQAEAVADLIASNSEAAHKVAMNQMRGGFSRQIKELREQLIHFASLVELELDFSEEDVEFADRTQLEELIQKTLKVISGLIASFKTGNAIRNGVPVAIVGKPNAGKSTLLNALLNEERALVTDIAGTTRDTVEDEMVIEGIYFRFIDTAGLRQTEDTVEAMGVQRAWEKMESADIVLYLFDLTNNTPEEAANNLVELQQRSGEEAVILSLANKSDKVDDQKIAAFQNDLEFVSLSAKQKEGLQELKDKLVQLVLSGRTGENETLITNIRHFQSLTKTAEALDAVQNGMQMGISGDLLAADIRQALFHLGEITGEITTDDLLGNIFSKFCIGK
ncbi:tRNA uridine-5-carboxymethylaminomethyl(34) synthesis GTPase MnmE [bacterium SCSIO 12741]|nr:tRNA uridine-5-carboxymethylaminomethyl(34) synthesis GTPase MnmE [bacterium SCSIO 12741]